MQRFSGNGLFCDIEQSNSCEEMLAAMIRGSCQYQREHLKEISLEMPLKSEILVCGGAVNPALIRAKQKWIEPARMRLKPNRP